MTSSSCSGTHDLHLWRNVQTLRSFISIFRAITFKTSTRSYHVSVLITFLPPELPYKWLPRKWDKCVSKLESCNSALSLVSEIFFYLTNFLFFVTISILPGCTSMRKGSKLSPLKQWIYGAPFKSKVQMLHVKEYCVWKIFLILIICFPGTLVLNWFININS